MSKRKTPEDKLAELVKEKGLPWAESALRFLKTYTESKPDPKARRTIVKADRSIAEAGEAKAS